MADNVILTFPTAPSRFFAVTPSDTTLLEGLLWLRVGGAGSLALKGASDIAAVTLAVADNEYIPFGTGYVMATGTTATGIVAAGGSIPTPTPTPSAPVISYQGSDEFAVISPVGGTNYQWMVDGVSQSGEIDPDSFIYNGSGIVTVSDGTSDSNLLVNPEIGSAILQYEVDFPAALDGNFSSYPGISQASGTAEVWQIVSNVLQQTTSGSSKAAHDTGTTFPRVLVNLKEAGLRGGDLYQDAANRFRFTLYSTSGGAGLEITLYPTSSNASTVVIGSTTYSGLSSGLRDGDVVEFATVSAGGTDYLQVFLNGTRWGPTGNGYDLTSFGTRSTYFAFRNNATAGTLGFPQYKHSFFEVYDNAGEIFGVTSKAVGQPTRSNPLHVDLAGSYDGSISSIDVLCFDAGGNVYRTWQDFAVSSNAFDVGVLLDSMLTGTSTSKVRIRDTATPADFADFPLGTIAGYQALAVTTEWGTQLGEVESYSSEAAAYRDLAPTATWQGLNSGVHIPPSDHAVPVGSNGLPTGEMVETGDSLLFKLFQGLKGIDDDVTVTWEDIPTGWTVSVKAASGCTAGTVDNTNKTVTITGMAADTAVTLHIQFIPDNPASPVLPANGMLVKAVRANETASTTAPFTTIALPSLRGGILRWMKAIGDGFPATLYGSSPYMQDTPSGTPELVAQAQNQLGHAQWVALPVNISDSAATAWAARFKAVASADGTLYAELSNEAWNGSYSISRNYEYTAACAGGDVEGVTADAFENYADSDDIVDQATGEVMTIIPTGTKFYTRAGYLEYAFEALRDIPTTETLSSSMAQGDTDTNVRCLAVPAQIKLGRLVFHARRSSEVAALMRTELSGHTTVETVIGAWKGEDPADLVTAVTSGGSGTEYGRNAILSPACYVPINHLDWATAPSWVTGYADQAAFEAGYIAEATADLATTKQDLLDLRHGVFDGWIAAGLPIDEAPRWICYEGNHSFDIGEIPSGDQAGFAAAYETFYAKSTYGQLTTDWLEAMEDIGFEGHILFQAHQDFGPAKEFKPFGIRTRVGLHAEQRAIALDAFLTSKGYGGAPA